MTIVDVMDIVRDETGQDVTPETPLQNLGLDSLEFLELLLRFPHISDALVPLLHTVNDIYLAVG